MDFQQLRYQAFLKQDPDDLRFDVVFVLEDRRLYAHAAILTLASDAFNAMLKNNKRENNNVVMECEYEVFKEFITFFYIQKCYLTLGNIEALLELAEPHGNFFNHYCDGWASKLEIDCDNALFLFKLAVKYFLQLTKEAVLVYVSRSMRYLIHADKRAIGSLDKRVFSQFFLGLREKKMPEYQFQVALIWCRQRAGMERMESRDVDFDVQEEVRYQICDFLKNINFNEMSHEFLMNFVVKNGYVMTYPKLSEVCAFSYRSTHKVEIRVTNPQNHFLVGYLNCDDDDFKLLKTQNFGTTLALSGADLSWITTFKTWPNKPCMKKKVGNEFCFLVFHQNGNIGLKLKSKVVDFDYIICEMRPSPHFTITTNCTIEVGSCSCAQN